MKKICALLACCMLAMPASADEKLTVLVYQHVKEQQPELGPVFRNRYPDIDPERALDAILDELPPDAAICIASKTPLGLNFLVGKNKAQTLAHYMNVDMAGNERVISLHDSKGTNAAQNITIAGSTHIMWLVVPDRAVNRNLDEGEVVKLLRDARVLLENFVATRTPGVAF